MRFNMNMIMNYGTTIYLAIITMTTTAPISSSISSPIEPKATTMRTTTPLSQSKLWLSTLTANEQSSQHTVSSNKERNWLLTKAWLIDNINRLRHELNELTRDYTQHIESYNLRADNSDKQLVHEMATLRADHTVLSAQQKQIIELMASNRVNSESNAVNAIPSVLHVKTKRHNKRHTNFKHLLQMEQQFENQTKRNISEIFTEITALHDITLTLFHEIQTLENRIEKRRE